MSGFDDSPYAAPADYREPPTIVARPGARVWRMAGDIVVERGAQLPPRCTHCNAEQISLLAPYQIQYWKTELDWPNDGSLLLLGLCDQCRSRRRRTAWVIAFTTIWASGMTIAGIVSMSGLLVVPGLILLIVAAVVNGRRKQVHFVAATATHARLSGFGREYVAQFPEAKRPLGK